MFQSPISLALMMFFLWHIEGFVDLFASGIAYKRNGISCTSGFLRMWVNDEFEPSGRYFNEKKVAEVLILKGSVVLALAVAIAALSVFF